MILVLVDLVKSSSNVMVKSTKPIAIGIIVRGAEVLIAKRSSHQHLGGLWEFPGGKVEVGETPYEALCRELNEEVGITVEAADALTPVIHNYDDRSVELHAFHVTKFLGEPAHREGLEMVWQPLNCLHEKEFPAGNDVFLGFLSSRFR